MIDDTDDGYISSERLEDLNNGIANLESKVSGSVVSDYKYVKQYNRMSL